MAQTDSTSTWIRSGALALGVSGLLFAAFPLVRPFFDDLGRDPTGAAMTMASPAWLVSHLMLIVALVLLPIGVLTVAAAAAPERRRTPLIGALLTLAGAALFLPVGGVEAFALPAIARLYLQGDALALAAVDAAHFGLQRSVFPPALLLMGLGGIFIAIGIGRWRGYPIWGAVALAIGLVSFMPLLPQGVRIVDGLLIGTGAMWLARDVWRGRMQPSVM